MKSALYPRNDKLKIILCKYFLKNWTWFLKKNDMNGPGNQWEKRGVT